MKTNNGAKADIPINSCAYKRPFDLSLLLIAHVLLLPLWLLIWTLIPIAIWLGDRGPIFYQQRRAGKNGQVFIVRKFRTMVPDADLKGPAWTVQGDSRLTQIGKFLRRTALDELPELWSVIKGDMSFVGPRPLDEQEQRQLEDQIPGFHQRLLVPPGLTGLAQVYDSTDQATVKLAYDLEYLGRLSPWLDCKLILRSVLNTIGARWDHRTGKHPVKEKINAESDRDQAKDEPLSNDKPIYRN